MKLAIYKILPLLLILNGCYTVILDPLRIREIPAENIKIDKYYDGEEVLPIVRDNQRPPFRYPYANMHNGYYYNDPYTYTRYNIYGNYVIPQRNTYVEVDRQNKVTPTAPPKIDPAVAAEKKRLQKLVWERRINPRVRKAPTFTRRQKDGE